MSEFTFKLPDLGEGTVEAEIAEWMVKVGDVVNEEDPICAMLTDKAAVELTAPVGGTVISVAGEEGDTVSVGSALIVFETSGEVAEKTPGESVPQELKPVTEAAASTAVAGPVAASAPGGKVMTSPSVRAHARAAGIDLSGVTGSGPRGRILKKDFDAFVSGGGTQPQRSLQPQTGTTEIKVIGLRRKIAERMAQAASEIPHFTYV